MTDEEIDRVAIALGRLAGVGDIYDQALGAIGELRSRLSAAEENHRLACISADEFKRELDILREFVRLSVLGRGDVPMDVRKAAQKLLKVERHYPDVSRRR